jgi:hypothetical protein
MKKVVFLIFLMNIFACRHVIESDYPVLSVDLTQLNTPSVFDIFKKIEIIPLETTKDCLIGQFFSVNYYNNNYYIFDSQSESSSRSGVSLSSNAFTYNSLYVGKPVMVLLVPFDIV